MSRITIQSISKAHGGDALFSDLSFEVVPGMRLAVAGPNGCGKSTLLKIIAGAEEADSGVINMERGSQLGYVAQEFHEADLSSNLLAWVLTALPSWNEFWRDWEQAVAEKDQTRINVLSHKQAEFEQKHGYNPDHKARTILSGLGFSEDDFFKNIRELSGGWRERAKLARVLLQGADVLLLDEPTNHLDLEAVEWLEEYLLNFRGTLLFVAHDRVFLNRVGTHVLFLGRGRPQVRRGSFDEFLEWEAENSRQLNKEVEKLSSRIDHEQDYIRRFRVKARKAAQAQSKIKKVEKMEVELSKLKETQLLSRSGKTLNFKLPQPSRGDKVAIAAVDLEFAYEGGRSVWPSLNFQLYRGKKIALAAPNGAGKSTLLKLLTGDLKPSAGYVKIGNNTKLAYFSQHQAEILEINNTVIGEIRRLCDPKLTEEQLMSVLGLFLLGESFFERKVSELSGGEKSRLLLASLFMSGANLLVLDEPTNHLDIESREGLVRALGGYDGTLLFVAHDRYLLSEVAEEVWSLTEKGFEHFLGGFAQYDASRKQEDPCETPFGEEPEKRKLSKEEKRRQAELRNQLYRKLKPLKSEYEKLEKELEKNLEEQGVLEEKMNDPATYEKPEEALKLNSQYREVESWVENLMERMAGIEAEMDSIQREQEALGEA
ncbi:ABC-F family ATP-binding cassette domain-containing protein [Salidesulfovibrio onnuriiensis]|uniref:ABC-F family ATP-binding cassette domain-containing protein n=1 Tax=Salidesulfovibrio onnuriiensis TaxID=2583823 RepID=UPI0011CC0501|nr:ABC-F family ATP-binding cassette domain-containing protein [Salidesulfovibrio onnuriiensis]